MKTVFLHFIWFIFWYFTYIYLFYYSIIKGAPKHPNVECDPKLSISHSTCSPNFTRPQSGVLVVLGTVCQRRNIRSYTRNICIQHKYTLSFQSWSVVEMSPKALVLAFRSFLIVCVWLCMKTAFLPRKCVIKSPKLPRTTTTTSTKNGFCETESDLRMCSRPVYDPSLSRAVPPVAGWCPTGGHRDHIPLCCPASCFRVTGGRPALLW